MTEPVISLRISANEKGTAPERFGVIILETQRHPERWVVSVDGEAEVDLVFSVEVVDTPTGGYGDLMQSTTRYLGVELKTPQDFVGSLQGHLSEQRRNSPYPLRIAVLGSLGDVLRALPEVTSNGWQNPRERAKAEAQIRRDISSLRASGVEVDFGISTKDYPGYQTEDIGKAFDFALAANVSQILHDARAILLEDTALRMSKCESWQEYCLRGLPGVGPTRAQAMIDDGCYLELRHRKWPIETQLKYVPGIGKKTAAKILEVMK